MAAAEAQVTGSSRLVSLDVFRGMTVAGMVLVNNPGTWSAIYDPLKHAEWNGITPTDYVFPFFLFIVGVAISLALGKRIETGGGANREIYLKIFKRAAVIFLLGLFLTAFPFYNFAKGEWLDVSNLRIMGVLQRIAVCYLCAALIFVHTNWKQQAIIAAALLLVYWALMTLIPVPGCEITTINDKACNLAAYLDRLILTENHIWKQGKVFDPEGLLSTIPAIATTLAGVLCGHWLRRKSEDHAKVSAIFFFGVGLLALGYLWQLAFPLNKSLWTSSYVVYTAGLALCFLGFCYWLIDIKGYKKWAKPFVIFGVNALVLFVGSGLMAKLLGIVKVAATEDGKAVSLQQWIFNNLFLTVAAPVNASLMYAVSFILVWLLLMWLLYRKEIFIRI
ncbi:MAG TPA: heparan-alpha-glucosaminide N-acetyltransferase domain-containing protein [Pyrinomonadaceae bacterium]|nr:heparan-alpha-glucosaminide N-acetyltransferase domain-containing protein [Pyrinomonadaceae bacterium]